jgi:RpiR family transcriptional regulator, carbohydrate utilization regulator
VTVAISNSGRTRTVIDVATAAKEAGGKVVSITGSESPLSRLADVDLRASTFEDTESYTPMVSRLAALVVIDILATGVAIRGGDESMERILAMKQGLVMRQR